MNVFAITYHLFPLLLFTPKSLFLFDLPGILILKSDESIVFLVTKIVVAEYSRPATVDVSLSTGFLNFTAGFDLSTPFP